MSKIIQKIIWYDSTGVPIELDDVENINITRGINSKNNSADITLKNPIVQRGSDGMLYTKYVDSVTGLLKFDEGQTIKIYIARREDNTAIDINVTSNDLVMSAEIQEINIVISEGSTKLKLSCVDKSYTIFNRLWSSTYTKDSSYNTAPLIIQNIVRWASINQSNELGFNTSGSIVSGGWQVDARLDTDGGFIQTTRKDDSAFPDIQIGKSFKPIYEWLDDLSTTDYTNDYNVDNEDSPTQDRTMIYYIDERNRFHWFYPQDYSTTTLNENITSTQTITTLDLVDASGFESNGLIQIGKELFYYSGKSTNQLTGVIRGYDNTVQEDHSINDVVTSTIIITQSDNDTGNIWLESNMTYKTFDIVNAVIYNAGDDMNGSGVLGLFYDKTTTSPKLKMVYKPWLDIARQMKIEEQNYGVNNSLTTITHVDGDQYDYPTDYNDYEPAFVGTSKLPVWNPAISIGTDGAYNTAFRNRAKQIAEGKAKALTANRGSARWKGTITLQFRRFHPGKLVRVTSSLTGIKNKYLRIQTVQYNIANDSGTVQLNLEEDEKKQGV